MIVVDIILASPIFPANILVTIIAARAFINIAAKYDADVPTFLLLTLCCLLLWPLTMPFFEYGTQVFMFALAGHYVRRAASPVLQWTALIVGVASFTLIQASSFAMNMLESGVMLAGLLLAVWQLQHFHLRSYPRLSAAPGQMVWRYLGRNTHYYYVGHHVLFQLIQLGLYPPASWSLQFFRL
jgi:hypothetical protein